MSRQTDWRTRAYAFSLRLAVRNRGYPSEVRLCGLGHAMDRTVKSAEADFVPIACGFNRWGPQNAYALTGVLVIALAVHPVSAGRHAIFPHTRLLSAQSPAAGFAKPVPGAIMRML